MRNQAASWRPVGLTSHVMKTMKRIVRNIIVNHLELNYLMNNKQHVGRRKKSCLSQLLEHHDEISRMLEENVNVDVVYAEFGKAYKNIHHKNMLEKRAPK